MSSTTSITLPAGRKPGNPETVAAVKRLSRMPTAFGHTWMVAVSEYANRTTVYRVAQSHHGYEVVREMRSETAYAQNLLHWHLAAWSPEFEPDTIADLKRLER